MSKRKGNSWIDRFRIKFAKISIKLIESRLYKFVAVAFAIFFVARMVDISSGPDFPGPLQKIPDLVVSSLFFLIMLPLLAASTVAKKFIGYLDEDSDKE